MLLRIDRVYGLFRRYLFIYMRANFRILDVAFWPVMDLLVWGFVSVYLVGLGGGGVKPSAVTFLIGAIILFNILYRSQQAVTISLLEDLWSRNLLNVFVAPITVAEFVCATYMVGLTQVVFVGLSTSILAYFLYSFNILSLGFLLIPLFLNLIVMGWSLGLFASALILRYGHQAELWPSGRGPLLGHTLFGATLCCSVLSCQCVTQLAAACFLHDPRLPCL
jgi:ABC-2 type transport system permease protein